MPAVFVHGNPETADIWDLLIPKLNRDDVITLSPPGFGAPTGGPSHLRRDLTLEMCGTVDTKLARWSVGLFDY